MLLIWSSSLLKNTSLSLLDPKKNGLPIMNNTC
jgi:hypothetical protein